jgi:endo-chitodextinase
MSSQYASLSAARTRALLRNFAYFFFAALFCTAALSGKSFAAVTTPGSISGDADRPPYLGLPKAAKTEAKLDFVAQPVYRFYNNTTRAHFYTMSEGERDVLRATNSELTYEGVVFGALASAGEGAVPVFRFFNTQTRAHFYTADPAERDYVLSAYANVIPYEGIAYYVFPNASGKGLPLYRFYNTQTRVHFYTSSEMERAYVLAALPTYNYEGVAYRVIDPNGNTPFETISNQKPSVTVKASPTTGLRSPATLTLVATASDPDGSVAKVMFYLGANKLGEVTTPPYKFVAQNIPGGRQVFTAIAVDDQGATASANSDPVDIEMGGNLKPKVTLQVTPPPGGFLHPATIDIRAEATDLDGTVKKVTINNGSTRLADLTVAPFTYRWTPVLAGSYTLRATAYDDKGLASDVTELVVVVRAPPSNISAATKDAARFLAQATFGPKSVAEIDVVRNGGYEAWLNDQFSLPTTPHVYYLNERKAAEGKVREEHSYEAIWNQWLKEGGQLRGRMAFALSEIVVISNIAPDLDAYGMSSYYDMLNRNAFGNYRQLLEEVTLHPTMGYYLNMQGSKKEDPAKGTHPNENYAREVLQLFSVGLYKLNQDGSRQLAGDGKPIPTYDESVVKGFARAFSGWNFAGNNTSDPKIFDPAKENWLEPMQPWEMHHEPGEKKLLDGVVIQPGFGARQDLKLALDNIFNHPNVGPFIGRQLIQRFVTSNPSPAYISRVAGVFNNNGAGVRGDLRAVIRAVLLDPEARDLSKLADPKWGKQREPVIRFANYLRATGAKSTSGRNKIWYLDNADQGLGQSPLLAPSVFNFFSPNYRQPGPLAAANLVAPEFQITTETSMVGQLNFFGNLITSGGYGSGDTRLVMDLVPLNTLGADAVALVDRLNLLLMSGTMSDEMRNIMINTLSSLSIAKTGGGSGTITDRVKAALMMIALSPEYAIQK